MKFDVTLCGIALAGAALALVTAWPAQDAAAPRAAGQDPPAGDPAAPAMPDVSDMLPNEHHEKLAALAGTWNLEVKFRFTPDMEYMVNSGTAEIAAIMGGRFVHETVKGGATPMGPFEGMGVSGYDNASGQYQSVWWDNQNTALVISTGEDDPATGHVTWHSETSNMQTGAREPVRGTMQKVNDSEWLYKAFQTTAGHEWQSLEIRYTKAR